MIAHLSIGGSQVRVRLSNAYGTHRLHVGAARGGLRSQEMCIAPGTDRQLTFGGAESASIPAGALVVSDPVDLELPPLADVAVSVYVPGAVPSSFQMTGHGN